MREQWLDNRALNEWLANGERGISSEAIVAHLTGRLRLRRPAVPYDPDDFRRCELLLRAVPLLRHTLPLMAELGTDWAALVARWDEIAALIEHEAPGYLNGARGFAPKAYALMLECRGVDA